MKTSHQWIEENSLSGALDHINSTQDAIEFIEAIQHDALSDPLANASDQQELEMARSSAMNERIRADQLHEQLLKMREKWLEARKHLRAANKGAERNAVALGLAVAKASSMDTLARQQRDREERKHETIVWNWMLLSDEGYRLKFGDPITFEHLYAFRILLKAMLGTRILKL